MKVIITESQEQQLAEQLKNKYANWRMNRAGNKMGKAADKVANLVGGTKDSPGLSPEMAARFDDIDIEGDAPNLAKFLKGMKNPDDLLAKLQGEDPGTPSAPSAPGRKGTNIAALIPKGTEMMHPLGHKTRISSNFGRRNVAVGTKNHKGVDLSTPSGSPVYAPLDGVVTKSLDTTPNACGGHIRIDHGNLETKFCHLSRMIVRKGQKVKKGEIVGYSGGGKGDPHPGTSTGPHLHYEILGPNGIALEPTDIQSNLA